MVGDRELIEKKDKLSVIGLGYVGLPIAVAFAKHLDVIGFDINAQKIARYQSGVDVTGEVGNAALAISSMRLTADAACLKEARFHIVAVPTPVRDDKTPDLSPVEGASVLLGKNLTKGSVVVYESTVYPGVTEDVCVPILERESGLRCGVDFKVGYSPERINPGDQVHRLETITKIVSGMDEETLETVARVYSLVVKAGVYQAPSIKVAEAAKVIENSQRDINIAFMNELAIIFHKLGIDTKEVLKAAETKWNFLSFRPGLVGGHCIGVDPYYLTYRAEQAGYHSQVILSGRRINDNMGKYIAENAVKLLIQKGKNISRCKVGILGFTFKENCPDVRNTRVIDIVTELRDYGIEALVSDPVADAADAQRAYQISLSTVKDLENLDCLIVAVAHDSFANIDIAKMLHGDGVLVDVKGKFSHLGTLYKYWSL